MTAVRTLVAAESSKHRLLVEAVRRGAAASDIPGTDIVDEAFQLLSQVEEQAPEVADEILSLPQVGGWAVRCLQGLAVGRGEGNRDGHEPSVRTDLRYIAGLAAAAALQVGIRFELRLLTHDGRLLLPGLGIRTLSPAAEGLDFVLVRQEDNGAAVICDGTAFRLPDAREKESKKNWPGWLPIPRLRIESDGLVLDALLDGIDPYLGWVSDHIDPEYILSGPRQAEWKRRIGAAWQLLTRRHRCMAQALSATVSAIVPLTGTPFFRPRSATSGWTFGAIGTSLPQSDKSLAEALVHEFQHLLLGAVEDLIPLVNADQDTEFGYAPWRDDPRPAGGRLHGSYAYLGVSAFWRQECQLGLPDERLQSAVSYARWRTAALGTARALASSAALTQAGRSFVAALAAKLASWQADRVSAEAEVLANDSRIEHHARWRLNFLRVDASQVDALAQDWLGQAPASAARMRITAALAYAAPVVGPERGLLLEARYLSPAYVASLLARADRADPAIALGDGDAALLRGDRAGALEHLRRRTTAAGNLDDWVGLAVTSQGLCHPFAAQLLAEQPELVAAVHARLRALQGRPPDACELAEWLSQRVFMSG
jgi:HEXXH motif-containing protein